MSQLSWIVADLSWIVADLFWFLFGMVIGAYVIGRSFKADLKSNIELIRSQRKQIEILYDKIAEYQRNELKIAEYQRNELKGKQNEGQRD